LHQISTIGRSIQLREESKPNIDERPRESFASRSEIATESKDATEGKRDNSTELVDGFKDFGSVLQQ